MWDKLESAQREGEGFRSELDKRDGFSMTKWFDKVDGPVKSICLVVALAGGLTGCNTMQFAGNYTNLQQEARMIDSMAVSEMAEFTQERGIEAADNTLPKVTVADFAQGIEEAHGFPYEGPVQLENPYVEGQFFKVFNGNSVGDHVKVALDQGVSALNWKTSAGGGTYLLNPDHPNPTTKFGMDSFHDPDHASTIVVGDNVFHNWDPGATSAENASFMLYHELAHGHVTQEVSRFGFSESFVDALSNTNINTVNETHADVTASIMVYKHLDLDANTFLERLDNLRAYSDKNMLDMANGDGTSDHWYRAQESIKVLNEMVDKDADFLKNLPDSHVPIVAYEVVKHAGFDHNLSDVLIANYSDLGEQARPSADHDAHFLSDVASSYDDPQLNAQAERLNAVWGQTQANGYLDFYQDALNKVLSDRVNEIPGQHLDALGEKFEQAGGDYTSVADLVDKHIEIAQSDSDPRLIKHQLKALAGDLKDLASDLPNANDLKMERSDLIASMMERVSELGQAQEANDPYTKLAHGQSPDSTPNDIATNIMKGYTVNGIDITPQQPFADIDTSEAKISFNAKIQQLMEHDHRSPSHDH